MRVKTNRFHLYPMYSKKSKSYMINDFDVECSSEHDDEKAYFTTTPNVTNETILDLFNNNKLKLLFHIECSLTKHRESKIISFENTNIVEIDLRKLNKKTEVSFWIVSTEHLYDIEFVGLNEFYSDVQYDIPAFSYLGYSDSYEFYFNKIMNDDAKPSSLFRVSKTEEDYMYYEFDDTGIIIRLPEVAYDKYQDMKGYAIEEKISMVIIPVLVSVLNDIKEGTLSRDKYYWMTVIEKKLKELGYEDGTEDVIFLNTENIKLSQEIFKDIIPSALLNLEGAYQSGEDD